MVLVAALGVTVSQNHFGIPGGIELCDPVWQSLGIPTRKPCVVGKVAYLLFLFRAQGSRSICHGCPVFGPRIWYPVWIWGRIWPQPIILRGGHVISIAHAVLHEGHVCDTCAAGMRGLHAEGVSHFAHTSCVCHDLWVWFSPRVFQPFCPPRSPSCFDLSGFLVLILQDSGGGFSSFEGDCLSITLLGSDLGLRHVFPLVQAYCPRPNGLDIWLSPGGPGLGSRWRFVLGSKLVNLPIQPSPF